MSATIWIPCSRNTSETDPDPFRLANRTATLRKLAETSQRTEIRAPADEATIRRMLQESQLYECRVLYTNPQAFNRSKMSRYWVAAEQGGKAVVDIEATIANLLNKGLRYGSDLRLELFDIRSIRVFAPGDYAEVETTERWYLPVYRKNGERFWDRQADQNWNLTYYVRKLNGTWLIQASTAPYTYRKR